MGATGKNRLSVIEDGANIPVYYSSYLSKFSCIGPECEDSCCRGWSVISVDKKTKDSYSTIEPGPLADELKKRIIPRKPMCKDHEYQIRLNEDSSCPFHDQNQLCKIQSQLGEEFLSFTCGTYPRDIQVTLGVYEYSGVLSCPEIARLALLDREGIDVSVREIQPRQDIDQSLVLDETKRSFMAPATAYEVRNCSLAILKERTESLGDRLLLLGSFLNQIDEAQRLESASLQAEILDRFSWSPFDYRLPTETLHARNAHPRIELLTSFLREYDRSQKAKAQRYHESFSQIMDALRPKKRNTTERYLRAYRKHYRPFILENSHIFENLLVHSIYRILPTASNLPSFLDAYTTLLLRYSLICSHLVGIAAYHKQLNEELCIKVIQSFSKLCEHSPRAWQSTLWNLRREGGLSMEHLAHFCWE